MSNAQNNFGADILFLPTGNAANTSPMESKVVGVRNPNFQQRDTPKLYQGSLGRSSNLAGETKRESRMSEPTREEYDAKLVAVESRTEAALARMEAQIGKLPTGDDIKGIRGNIWGAAAVVIATVIGIFSLWAVGFDSGIQITSTSVQDAIGAKSAAEENARNIEDINKKMDSLISIIQGRVAPGDDAQKSPQ